jgi:predicted methyltransferase
MKLIILALFLLVLLPIQAAELAEGFDAALASEARPEQDKARDPARKPRAVLQFVGIGQDMVVLDAIAGGGWYTEVLAAAVGPGGKVYAQNGERMKSRVGEAMAARAKRLGNVEVIYTGPDMVLPMTGGFDAAFTALNLHDVANRDEAYGLGFLRAIHGALKPGGVFGVIDHVGVAGADNTSLHRIETARAKDLLIRAGFEIEAESDVLAHPEDDHTTMVMNPEIRGMTDRMLIRARKPMPR